MSSRWSPEEDATLRRMIAQHHTHQEIATQLNRTRDMVISYCRFHRVRSLNAQPHYFKHWATGRHSKPAVHRPPTQPKQPTQPTTATATPFILATRKQCHYPLWDDNPLPKIEDRLVCGARGYPYCQHHYDLTHNKPYRRP